MKVFTTFNRDRLLGLQPHLEKNVRGQDHAIEQVCSVLERGELGLTPHEQPKGSLLFLGPTGVGKTTLAVTFTRYLFGLDKLFRFDMSEYQHPDAIKALLGDESGQLGRLGRVLTDNDYGTLLFDEMEKANPLVLDLFLQILDAARITVADGTTLSLSNWYVVFTSNIGSAEIMGQHNLPFTTVERFVHAQLQQKLRPEFVARFQEIIVFRKLGIEIQREIAQDYLGLYLDALAGIREIQLTAAPEVVEFLIRHGFHRTLGARPLHNAVLRFVGDAIRVAFRKNTSHSGELIVEEDRLAIIPAG